MNIHIMTGLIVSALIIMTIVKVLFEKRIPAEVIDDFKHFVKKDYLMTIVERKFYDILVSIVGEKYHVVPQMVLSNLVSVNKYEKHKMGYRNKINRYILDFVLYEKPYFTPYLVIELDDTSHLLPERESRDIKVDTILEGVGVRIVHVKTAHEYDREEIFNLLRLT